MIALISISNISQQSINKEKDLREQLDKLREQNKDLENIIEREQAKLERNKLYNPFITSQVPIQVGQINEGARRGGHIITCRTLSIK